MKVAFLPTYPNPYQRLLRDGLKSHGVEVAFLEGLPSSGWLRARRAEIDVLHYHWLHGLYMARFATPFQVARFIAHLRQARGLGYRIVWTAHNVLPHNAPIPPLHAAIRRLIMRDADAVIVHCEAGRHELLARFPRSGPVDVIPLGSYGGLYPVTTTQAKARATLGITPTQFVYLALGNIAVYKGLDQLVGSFCRVAAPDDVALIAGRNRDAGLVNRLRRVAAQDSRFRVHAEFVPDEQMQQFLLAADVLVAPFERVLTSSSVMVGLAYGLPVIVPALGCLPELVTAEAGIVYAAGDPAALDQALIAIKSRDRSAMSVAARRVADGLQWDDIAQRTAAVYEACLAS